MLTHAARADARLLLCGCSVATLWLLLCGRYSVAGARARRPKGSRVRVILTSSINFLRFSPIGEKLKRFVLTINNKAGGPREYCVASCRLLLNHSPARSHVTLLFCPSDHSKTITQNPNPNPSPESRRCPGLNHDPNPSSNPNPNEQLKFVHQFAAHWSRDLEKTVFSPWLRRVAFLPYVMWGDLESASKNTSDPILKIQKERFLIFPLACDLVLARFLPGDNRLCCLNKNRRYGRPIGEKRRKEPRCPVSIYSNQSPSRAPRAATRGACFAAARAACVSTWLGEGKYCRLITY